MVVTWPYSLFFRPMLLKTKFSQFSEFLLNRPHLADSVIESPCPSVRVSVVVRHRVQEIQCLPYAEFSKLIKSNYYNFLWGCGVEGGPPLHAAVIKILGG